MNQNKEYEDYFNAIVAAEGIDYPNETNIVKAAVRAGLSDFWGATKK